MANRTQKIIQNALSRGQSALSEYESKRVLAAYGIPISKELLVTSASQARAAAKKIGYPIVLKACSPNETHKTEKGLVVVNLSNQKELNLAWLSLGKKAGKSYKGAWLVQEMVKGSREIMIGMHRDPGFGPAVMFGLGGIFTEILQDVVFRVAPLRKRDASDMLRGIRAKKILNEIRGLPAANREILTHTLMAVGQIALDHPDIAEIDINPMIIRGAKAVAVDGLIMFSES
ncbi:MAG: carboxylate--amine ligase [Rhodospirillaceae bacterium]|nr:carboxylate--amine ligase [Rhodospirillaceae bacterium]|tara:strand:- start:7876 stop:8568 length:693 start_codon:yes stop_codon:yes gene_type:complete